MSSQSYGYAYLTSYGWTGTGTGLREGAIEKPLAIPPKKNLGGLGKDRDEAFPFWDHLFTVASKAITIKVSSDDEDASDTEVPPDTSHPDPASVPLQRTTTGIISNRRPISGTPASTSGSTTPHLNTDANVADGGRLSLISTAKKEAAKRGLYARFFRGPVLGPDGPPVDAMSLLASPPSESETDAAYAPIRKHVCEEGIVGETKKSRKRKSEDKETEERRERKRLKKERKAARAAKRAERALAGKKGEEKKDQLSRRVQKYRDEECSEENQTPSYSKKARKQAKKSVARLARDRPQPAERTRQSSEEESGSTVNGQQEISLLLSTSGGATNPYSPLTTKRKKRKDTLH